MERRKGRSAAGFRACRSSWSTCRARVSMNPRVDTMVYVTSAEEIGWGIGLVALTLCIHAFGMIMTLRFDAAFKARFGQRPSFVSGMSNLVLMSWLLVSVHLVEVMMWASFFQWKQCFRNYSVANYFALNEYTTVGSS